MPRHQARLVFLKKKDPSRLTRADSTPQVLEGRGLGVKRVMRGDLFVEFTGAHSGAPPGGAPGDARRFYHMSSKLGDDIAFWECFVLRHGGDTRTSQRSAQPRTSLRESPAQR